MRKHHLLSAVCKGGDKITLPFNACELILFAMILIAVQSGFTNTALSNFSINRGMVAANNLVLLGCPKNILPFFRRKPDKIHLNKSPYERVQTLYYGKSTINIVEERKGFFTYSAKIVPPDIPMSLQSLFDESQQHTVVRYEAQGCQLSDSRNEIKCYAEAQDVTMAFLDGHLSSLSWSCAED